MTYNEVFCTHWFTVEKERLNEMQQQQITGEGSKQRLGSRLARLESDSSSKFMTSGYIIKLRKRLDFDLRTNVSKVHLDLKCMPRK